MLIRVDKRLLDPHPRKVITPLRNFLGNTWVCEEESSWLPERVNLEFFPHEAQAILSIPLSICKLDDSLIWHGTF